MSVSDLISAQAGRPGAPLGSYSDYVDSGVETLGHVPAHWKVLRLKHVAKTRNTKIAEKPEDSPFIGLEHIESWTGRLLLDSQPETVESAVESFASGDVLLGKLRPYLAKVARPGFKGVCTGELLVLVPRDRITQGYLFYSLLNPQFIDLLDSMTYGTKMPRASPQQIGNTAITVPPLNEQVTIVGFLDLATAKIDALIAKKERLIELLQEKRTALITRAVTKGLDMDVPMKDSGVHWIGQMPSHWDIKKGRHIGALLGTVQAEDHAGDALGSDSEALKVDHLNAGTGLYISAEHEQRFAASGHQERLELLLFPKRGAAIFTNKVRVAKQMVVFDSNIMGWAIRGGFSAQYVAYALLARGLSDLADISSVPQINNKHIYPASFPSPPYDEQIRIALALDHQTVRLDYLAVKVREAIETLREYRSALISAAVTGKIDVRDAI